MSLYYMYFYKFKFIVFWTKLTKVTYVINLRRGREVACVLFQGGIQLRVGLELEFEFELDFELQFELNLIKSHFLPKAKWKHDQKLLA